MKNKIAIFSLMLVAFLGGIFGFAGCGDKYQNLSIELKGANIVEEEDGSKYIDISFDESDPTKNVIEFSATILGYTEDMVKTMKLSVPQDKAVINSTRTRGDTTTFNVTILTSGIIPVVVYSNETHKVSASLKIRSLLPTSAIEDNNATLTFMRPTIQENSKKYLLNDEQIVKFTPTYSSVRAVKYEIQNIQGVSIEEENGLSYIVVDNNAVLGMLPITVTSLRAVSGSSEYAEDLTDEQKEKLSTTVYALIYDSSWGLDVYNTQFEDGIQTLKLSSKAGQYTVNQRLASFGQTKTAVDLSSVGNLHAVYFANTNNKNICYVEENDGAFDIYSASRGSASLTFGVDLYYVPNYTGNGNVANLNDYKKVLSYEKQIDVEVIDTPTYIQLTNANGITSNTNATISIYEQQKDGDGEDAQIVYGKDAYISVNVTPLTLPDAYKRFTLDLRARNDNGDIDEGYTNRAKEIVTLYYYSQNNVVVPINLNDDITDIISSGVNGTKIYIAFNATSADIITSVELVVKTLQITDVDDTLTSIVTCNFKDSVISIDDINTNGFSIIHEVEDVKYAYISMDDSQNGVACAVKYTTKTYDSSSSVTPEANQSFIVNTSNNSEEVVRIITQDNSNKFVLYPRAQGSVEVSVTSENNITYKFIVRVIKSAQSFSINYEQSTGKTGEVTRYNGEIAEDDEISQPSSILNYGLKTMYLQADSRIRLNAVANPTGADIIATNQPYTIYKIQGEYTSGISITQDNTSGESVIYLNAKKAGEYNVVCVASTFVKDENGIYNISSINRGFKVYVFNKIEGVVWTINNEEFYVPENDNTLVYEIYDNDSVAFDKQNTFPYNDAAYYLNQMGLQSFMSAGQPHLNASALSSKELYISFYARPYGTNRQVPNYINSETSTSSQIPTDSTQAVSYHYSIDYASGIPNKLASIINVGTDSQEYTENDSTQLYSPYNIWMGFTSVLDDSAKEYVYEYKISVIITQANTIQKTSVFTLRIIQPVRSEYVDTVDEINLEYGGLNTPSTALNISVQPNNVYDARWVYSLGGQGLSVSLINEVKGIKDGIVNSVLDNGIIRFDPNTMQLSISPDYTGSNADTSITFYALDSIALLRDVPTDVYTFGTAGGQPVFVATDGTNILGYTAKLPIFKTINVHINSGESPNSPFVIKTANEFKNFITNIYNGNTYEGQYIKVENDIYGINIPAGLNTNGWFSGVLFADNKTTLHFLSAPLNLFGKIKNGSINNIDFVFSNAFESVLTECPDTQGNKVGILASIIVNDYLTPTQKAECYYLNTQTNAYEEVQPLNYSTIIYNHIFNNVSVSLNNNVIINTQNNAHLKFGVIAGNAVGAEFNNCEVNLQSDVAYNELYGVIVSAEIGSSLNFVSGFIGVGNKLLDDENNACEVSNVITNCVVRMYGNNAIISNWTAAGFIASAWGGVDLSYSYVLAYDKTQPNIQAKMIAGLVVLQNGSAECLIKVNHCFVSANIYSTVGANSIAALIQYNYSSQSGTPDIVENNVSYNFVNVVTSNTDIALIFFQNDIGPAYINKDSLLNKSYANIVENGVANTTTYGLDFDNLDSNFTTLYPSYNNGLPLLTRVDGSLLYDNILPEINCNILAETVLAYDSLNQPILDSQRIILDANTTYALKDLIDTTNFNAYPVALVRNYSSYDVTITQNTYFNVGNTTIKFNKAGEYLLTLVSQQDSSLKQVLKFLVKSDTSNVKLYTESNGEDVELSSGKEVLVYKNETYSVNVLDMPNDVSEIAYIRYITDNKDAIVFSTTQPIEWVENGSEYYVDIPMSVAHTIKMIDNATISYKYVLKYVYNYTEEVAGETINKTANYQDIVYNKTDEHGVDVFTFNVKIVPNVSLNINSADLYTSDELLFVVTADIIDAPKFNYNGDYINNLSAPITNQVVVDGKTLYTYTYYITVKDLYKQITQNVSQVIDVIYNDEVLSSLNITIMPTPIASILPLFYYNGQDALIDDTSRSSHTIIPGGEGILKLEVTPSYANYDYIEVYSTELQNTTIFFTQYYKNGNSYVEIPNGSSYSADGKLLLQKLTGIKAQGKYFDGTYYISTYLPTSVKEDVNCFYIKITPKLNNGQEVIDAFSTVDYAVYPGFVSTVELKDVKTAKTDDNKYLIVANQTFAFNLNLSLRNARVNITTSNSAVTIYSDAECTSEISADYVNNKTLSQEVTLYAKVGSGVTKDEEIRLNIQVYQDGQLVGNDVYTFIVANEIITDYHIVWNKDETTGIVTMSDELTIGTNSYTQLIMYYNNGVSADYIAWNKINFVTNNFNAWLFETKNLEAQAYTYFTADKYGEENKNWRLIGNDVVSGLTLTVKAYIYYNTAGELQISTELPNDPHEYKYVQTINYNITLNVVVDSTEEKPLHIDSVEDFKKLNGKTGQYYMLTNDLVLDNWEPFELNVANLDFNNHKVVLRSLNLTSQKTATSTNISAGLFTSIGVNTVVKNLILDVSMLVYVDALDKSVVDFGFVAGINQGIIYNVDVVAFKDIKVNTSQGEKAIDWIDLFNYKQNNDQTDSLGLESATLDDSALGSTQDTFNYLDDRLVSANTKSIFNQLKYNDEENKQQSPISVFILTGGYATTLNSLTTHIGGIAGTNNGFITNARVGRSGNIVVNGSVVTLDEVLGNEATSFNLYAGGNVAGLVGLNTNVISSSYFANGYVINSTNASASSTKTAGLVAEQNAMGRVYGCYVQGGINTQNNDTMATNGGVKSQGTVAGLVHTNDGVIENSLSNIPLYSSMGVGGLVYTNSKNGKINTSISLSKVQSTNSLVNGLFVGVDTKQDLQNFGSVTNSYYLIQDTIIQHPAEQAIGLDINQLGNASKYLYGFSLYDKEQLEPDLDIDSFVWQIYPKTQMVGEGTDTHEVTSATFNLIAANKITYGLRDENANYLLKEEDCGWGDKNNPIVLANAEDFNRYFGEDTIYYSDKYFRIVADIDFNEFNNFPIYSYKKVLENTHLQGNGLDVKNLSFNTEGGDNSSLSIGLFSAVKNSVVSGLNIKLLNGILAGDFKQVGALTGEITESSISNINISGTENSSIIGYNMSGGLAGVIKNSSLSNIVSGVSVSSSYIAASSGENKYSISTYSAENTATNKQCSYAGGIAGIIDEESTAEFLVVDNAKITISAEHSGGLVGYLGAKSTLTNSKFVLADPSKENAQLITSTNFVAGGLVAENLGKIKYSYVDYNQDVQKALDTQALSSTDVNNTLGNLDIFASSNSIAIGGLVGLNFGGSILDSYTRAEVVSKKAHIAGGLIGIATNTLITSVDTSQTISGLLAYSDNSESGLIKYAVSDIDRVYTTSFVYAKQAVGGLIGYLNGQVYTNTETTIVAVNKMPQTTAYNYNNVAYKGNTIGYYRTTSKKDIFVVKIQGQEEAAYSNSKYGIFAVNKGGTNKELAFEYEIGNLAPSNQLYTNFLEGYSVSYLDTIQKDTIIFNGLAMQEENVWAVDTTKTESIMPTLRTNNVVYTVDIKTKEDWVKLQQAYGAVSTYNLIDNLTIDDENNIIYNTFETFNAKNVVLQGNEHTVYVNVTQNFTPLFGDAEGLTLNNVKFVFNVTQNPTNAIKSLLCNSAINCSFNNVEIEIKNTLTLLAGTTTFGCFVGQVKDKVSIYNCKVSGTINFNGAYANEIRFGGLIGDLSYATTQQNISSINSNNYGNLTLNLSATFNGTTYIGGLVGYISGQHTVRGVINNTSNMVLNIKQNSTITANADLFMGGIAGYVDSASFSNISVSNKGTYTITGSANANIGGAFGKLSGIAKANNIVVKNGGEYNLTMQVVTNFGGVAGLFDAQTNAEIGFSTVEADFIITNTNTANVGVFVGKLNSTADKTNVINAVIAMGDLTLTPQANLNAGGLVGIIDSTKKAYINNSAVYSTINIQNGANNIDINIGGFAGVRQSGTLEINNSVAYGAIYSKYTGTSDDNNVFNLAGAVGAIQGEMLKLCIIGTAIIYKNNNLINVDAITNDIATNSVRLTKVYYVPNMVGQFSIYESAIMLSLNDLTNSDKWLQENSARTNPTRFAIPSITSQETQTLYSYFAVSNVIVNSITDNAKTRFIEINNLELIGNNTEEGAIVRLASTTYNTTNSITLNDNIARLVADNAEVTTSTNLFTQIPQEMLISGIKLKLNNNKLSKTINNAFGLLANENSGLVFDCGLGSIIDEDIQDDAHYVFTEQKFEENSGSFVNYYDAPNWTVLALDIGAGASVGGLVGNNLGQVNGCYAYADFVFTNTANNTSFGGLVGTNSILTNSYIIGRQVYTINTSNLGKVFNASGNAVKDCVSYVVYYVENGDVEVKNTILESGNTLSAIWKTISAYNYGISMFTRYYNNEDIKLAYYTGDGLANPYEIIDYMQLYSYLIDNPDVDVALVKNVFVTNNSCIARQTKQPTIGALFNGNGKNLYVKSYTQDIRTNEVVYTIFNDVLNTADVYNLNLIIGEQTIQTPEPNKKLYFGGFALDCKGSVKNVYAYSIRSSTATGSENKITLKATASSENYAGGLFAKFSANMLQKCIIKVNFVLANDSEEINMGAAIGMINSKSLSIYNCKVDTFIGYLAGGFTKPTSVSGSILNIYDCYTTYKVLTGGTLNETKTQYNGITLYPSGENERAYFTFVNDYNDKSTSKKNSVNVFNSYYLIEDINNIVYACAYNSTGQAVNGAPAFAVKDLSDLTQYDELMDAYLNSGNYIKVLGGYPILKLDSTQQENTSGE